MCEPCQTFVDPERQEATAIALQECTLALHVLEQLTGLHRSKLGRIRAGNCVVTIEEANRIRRALATARQK